MANRFCNLDGNAKIKDEYGKINIGFDKVENEIDDLGNEIIDVNDRVNEIITTPVEGVSAQEIIDARHGEPTLGAKIADIEHVLDAHKAETASSGVHGIGSAAVQIYEAGTWTPTINRSGATYEKQIGRYVRIGDQVFIEGIIELSNKGTSNLGTAISALPFGQWDRPITHTLINVLGFNLIKGEYLVGVLDRTTINILIDARNAYTYLPSSEIQDTTTLRFSGVYRI